MQQDECKHLNFKVFAFNRIGDGFCPDCNKDVCLSVLFNNLAEEMRRIIAEAKK